MRVRLIDVKKLSHWMCLKWIEGRVIHNEQQ
ncbi:hypothetical protein FOVG_19534 [Fusarium oxysporum f. sp. pisi HDV247]|uniref:Uncharacterized protein n=1 Tax=Fusarium oxysporum f. sp. pisi HDV247 TaxID=1080344 RepID=W9N8E7_FUSOX|nr:hypothetical protein FOVG_19534 [Fusarium oxysporum f. sp. pisi HDV247]